MHTYFVDALEPIDNLTRRLRWAWRYQQVTGKTPLRPTCRQCGAPIHIRCEARQSREGWFCSASCHAEHIWRL